MKKLIVIINLILNYYLILIESKSNYAIENSITAKITITGNINGNFYIYDDLFDSGTQLKGYYKNGLIPRRELKYDELFRFFVILDYSCDNITVDVLFNGDFTLNTDEFVYVDVTRSFIPYKFRNKIFNPRRGSSKVFRTYGNGWYFGKDIPHTIVVFERITNIKDKFRNTACGDIVPIDHKNDKDVILINQKEANSLKITIQNSKFNDELDDGEADKIALENKDIINNITDNNPDNNTDDDTDININNDINTDINDTVIINNDINDTDNNNSDANDSDIKI
nr:7613_t:CDS:2 [Entrophospora candida]